MLWLCLEFAQTSHLNAKSVDILEIIVVGCESKSMLRDIKWKKFDKINLCTRCFNKYYSKTTVC